MKSNTQSTKNFSFFWDIATMFRTVLAVLGKDYQQILWKIEKQWMDQYRLLCLHGKLKDLLQKLLSLNYIEEIAKKTNCKKVCMEDYSPSQHLLDFYLYREYKYSVNKKI